MGEDPFTLLPMNGWEMPAGSLSGGPPCRRGGGGERRGVPYAGCDGAAPKDKFDLARVALNLDAIVEATGVSNSSSSQPMRPPNQVPNRRDGSLNPNQAGPLGSTLIRKLTDPATGIVLDSWIDADGQLQGGASGFIPP